MKRRICMIVRSDINTDARVDRELKSLAAAGYLVEVVNLGEGSKKGDVSYLIKKAFGRPKPGANIISVILRYIIFVFSSFYLGVRASGRLSCA